MLYYSNHAVANHDFSYSLWRTRTCDGVVRKRYTSYASNIFNTFTAVQARIVIYLTPSDATKANLQLYSKYISLF